MELISKYSSNCALVAIKQVRSDLSDDAIIKACTDHGFASGRGMYGREWRKALKDLQVGFERCTFWDLREGGRTLAAFCRRNKQGVFIVSVKGHALAVVDGRVVDPNYGTTSTRRFVYDAVEIINPRPLVERIRRGGRVQKDPLVRLLAKPTFFGKRNKSDLLWDGIRLAEDLRSESGPALGKVFRLSAAIELGYTRNQFLFDRRQGFVEVVE